MLDDVCCKNSSPSANHVSEENVDNDPIRQPTSLFCSSDVSSQRPYQDLQSYEETNEEDFCFVWDQQQSLVIHEFQDPFDSLLQSPKKDNTDVRKILISSYEDHLDRAVTC